MLQSSNSMVVFAALVTAALMPSATRAAAITDLGTPVSAGGYTFLNFNGPNSGTNAGAGTNINGISNSGAAVGFDIDNNGTFSNFVANINSANFTNPSNPYGTTTPLNMNGSFQAMSFGINSAGDVVGTDGNGNAVILPVGGAAQVLTISGSSAAIAFGINDKGNIVGQFTTASGQMPGFFLGSSTGKGFIEIDAPSGPDTVNAQGVNDNGLIVGFYVGTDGQDHGFMANSSKAANGQLTGTAIANPTIPNVLGEPGATFVFSQILGVNDRGLAVGYYSDSTTSRHGFLYNTKTGQYMFLDDPAEQFNNGVEVTHITGISNSDEITGFYSDANGVFHGFVACPSGVACSVSNTSTVPEPDFLVLASIGFAALGFSYLLRLRRAQTE